VIDKGTIAIRDRSHLRIDVTRFDSRFVVSRDPARAGIRAGKRCARRYRKVSMQPAGSANSSVAPAGRAGGRAPLSPFVRAFAEARQDADFCRPLLSPRGIVVVNNVNELAHPDNR